MNLGVWKPLRAELVALAAEGLRVPIWWRDDDATGPTPQLERLTRLASGMDLLVHLAVIPSSAEPALGPWLAGGPLRAVVHGWSHRNHAPNGTKSSEFGTPGPSASTDAARGLSHLRSLFGGNVHPMFVPPWNRIHPGVIAELPAAGYRAVSTYGPRPHVWAAPGLAAINTHVDPIDWRGTRGLADPQLLLDLLVQHLQARRAGEADAQEPLGLLTHHLVMDKATWDFARGLLQEFLDCPTGRFDIASGKDFA